MKCMLFLFLVICGTLSAQNLDCQRFHEGKFYHEDNNVILGTVIRKGDKQVEIYDKNRLTCKVKWVSECEYELHVVKANRAFIQAKGHQFDNMTVHVRIVATEENGYYFSASLAGAKESMDHHHFIFAK